MTMMEPPRFLALFNQPIPKLTQGRRDTSNVPNQALALLNDPFVVAMAEHWGARVVARTDESAESRIAHMFHTAFARPPQPEETARFAEFAVACAELRGADPADLMASAPVWRDVAHAIFNLKGLSTCRRRRAHCRRPTAWRPRSDDRAESRAISQPQEVSGPVRRRFPPDSPSRRCSRGTPPPARLSTTRRASAGSSSSSACRRQPWTSSTTSRNWNASTGRCSGRRKSPTGLSPCQRHHEEPLRLQAARPERALGERVFPEQAKLVDEMAFLMAMTTKTNVTAREPT